MADPTDIPPGPGAHWVGIVDRAHDAIAGNIDSRKKAHVETVLHQLETDLAPLIGPIVQKVLDNPEATDELKALMAEAGTPAHQFGSLIIGLAIGAVIGPALGAALDPELEQVRKFAWQKNPSRVISPDVAAAAVLKGVLDQGPASDIAAFSGYNSTQFDHMVQAAGQSIGLAEALLLYRRGQITLAHLQEIIRYSNVNPRFYDDVPKLQYGPPPAGEVVAGLLKGHLSQGEAATKLGHAGIDPVELGWMRQTAGRPYSTEQALHLWNRNEIDEARVRQVIAQSDINTDYTDDILKLREYFPPPRSIVPMLRANGITEAQARQLLSYYGVQEPWASAFIAEAHTTKSQTTTAIKELTSAQVIRMYSTRLIPRAEANAKLLKLHYVQADVTLLLDFADDERHERILNATITKVGTKYVAHRLSVVDATHLLNVAGVPAAAQHDLFALWNVQRDANVVVPSASMVVGAYRRGDIGPLETKNRLLALGVQPADLDIFVADGYPPPKRADQAAAVAAVVNA